MLLEFKYHPIAPDSYYRINPRYVALVYPIGRSPYIDEKTLAWIPFVCIKMACGTEIKVLDPDNMVAKLIHDAQLDGGW